MARYADLCNVYGSVEGVARKFAVLRRHCAEVDRPYEAVTRTINYWALLARDEADRAALAARFPGGVAPQTAPEVIASLREYAAVGTEYAIVKPLNAADLEPLRHFAATVLPAFA